ncbi:MAG: alpha/beta fold hydrolase [Nannocystaceae bacterium]
MRIGRFRPAVADRSRMWTLSHGRMYLCERGDDGDAPPLLLLHGLLVHHYEFTRVIAELSRERRILAPDLYGCGDSDAPEPLAAEGYSFDWHARTVAELVDRLGIDTIDVLGHSTGGTVAACLARVLGPRVRRLVLVDTVAYDLRLPIEGRVALFPRVGPALFKNVYRRAELRRYFAKVFADPTKIDERAIDLYWDRLARPGHREAAHAMLERLVDMAGLGATFEAIRAPTLAVWGEEDRIVPLADGRRLAARIPGAELEVLPRCGHAPNEERPAELCAAVRGFLRA